MLAIWGALVCSLASAVTHPNFAFAYMLKLSFDVPACVQDIFAVTFVLNQECRNLKICKCLFSANGSGNSDFSLDLEIKLHQVSPVQHVRAPGPLRVVQP